MAETRADNTVPEALSPSAGEQLTLSLADLLPDAEGNVVLFNDAGVTEMSIVSEKPVVDSGVVDDGAATSGDVAGMAYYSFDSGPTLYCPMEIHISIITDTV